MNVVEITVAYLRHYVDGTGPTRCPACTNPIEAGQYVLFHHHDPLDFAQTDVHIHVACVRGLIENTPEDLVAPAPESAAADSRRRRVLASIAADQRARAA